MAFRELPYKKLEEVKIEAIENSSISCFLLHQKSNMDLTEISESLKLKKILYTSDFPPEFAPNHSLFASRDESIIKNMEKANQKYFSNPSESRKLIIDTYSDFNHPECCLDQVKYDIENNLPSLPRLGMQLIDIVNKYNISGSKFLDYVIKDNKSHEEPKSLAESKDDWIKKETKAIKEETEKTNDDLWSVIVGVNDEFFRSGEPELRRAFLNVRLARELPMCSPDCEKIFDNYTTKLISTSNSLGYSLGSIADGATDFLREAIESYWDGRKAKKISELELIANSGILKGIKASDIQIDTIRDCIMATKNYEERILSS
jgi:hypothetical protein